MIAILELREGHVPGRIVVVLELSDDARVPRVELLVMESPAQRHRCDDRRGGQRRENHVSQTCRIARSRRPIAAGARRPPPGCVRPAQQADSRDSQRAGPEPDPERSRPSRREVDRQQPGRGCEAGGEEARHPPVSGGPLREHPSRQPDPWYACQQKNTGGGQRVSG